MPDSDVLRSLFAVGLACAEGDSWSTSADLRSHLARIQPAPAWVRAAASDQLELPSVDPVPGTAGLLITPDLFVEQTGIGPVQTWLAPMLEELASAAPAPAEAPVVRVDLPGVSISARSVGALEVVQRYKRLAARLPRRMVSDFAGSASYMGTKIDLVPLIVGALEAWDVPKATLVDLMTGSGVVAGSFARLAPTWASDAQSFATALAQVQGAGFSESHASDLLAAVGPHVDEHRARLSAALAGALEEEETAMAWTADAEQIKGTYAAFVRSFPTFPERASHRGWSPVSWVARARAGDPTASCLITAYYANRFFGVRQAIELDSIRYALDRISDSHLRALGLGALVVTASAIATGYGRHFAQPYVTAERLAERKPAFLSWVLDYRLRSVAAEFEARVSSLAQESTRVPFPVSTVVGDWSVALGQIAQEVDLSEATVYLDPPYTRDEFSRYYHVLESLVRYDYPDVAGKAGVPLKGRWRFASEFHTRNRERRVAVVSGLVQDVLSRGATVIWSHKSDLSITVADVVDTVAAKEVRTLGASHVFVAQGRRSRGKDPHQETVTLFRPD